MREEPRREGAGGTQVRERDPWNEGTTAGRPGPGGTGTGGTRSGAAGVRAAVQDVTDDAETGTAGLQVRLQVRLTPASSRSGFYARVSGRPLGAPQEFSDRQAFLRFLDRLADLGPD